MLIKKLSLENFRGIAQCSIDFDDDYNLIVGRNGIGKTTILEAISAITEWILQHSIKVIPSSRLRKEDIRIGAQRAKIAVEFEFFNQTHELNLFLNATNPALQIDNSDKLTQKKNSLFFKAVQSINNSTEEMEWPLHYYFDHNRTNFTVNKSTETGSSKKDAYLKNNYVLSSFTKWFEQRDAEEARIIRNTSNLKYRDPQLQAAIKVIKKSTDFNKIYYSADNPQGIRVTKYGAEFSFEQLSSGEKTLLFLMGDLARRCGLLNHEKPFEVSGVVLIDEIDLHLHPTWQRIVIQVLTKSFPKIQFIISTHSPQVVGEISSDKIRVLSVNKKGVVSIEKLSKETFGRDSNYILNTVLGADERRVDFKISLAKLDGLISKKKLEKANQLQKELENQFGDNIPELTLTRIRLERRSKEK